MAENIYNTEEYRSFIEEMTEKTWASGMSSAQHTPAHVDFAPDAVPYAILGDSLQEQGHPVGALINTSLLYEGGEIGDTNHYDFECLKEDYLSENKQALI